MTFFDQNRSQVSKKQRFWDVLVGSAAAIYDDSSRRNARLIATIWKISCLAMSLSWFFQPWVWLIF
jgi:hypothetical protein